MDRIELLVEELRMVRSEADQHSTHRNSILAGGLATTGAMFAGAIALLKDWVWLSAFGLGLFAPIASIYTYQVWFLATKRHYRASRYLKLRELKLGELVAIREDRPFDPENLPIGWDNSIRNPREAEAGRGIFHRDQKTILSWIPGSVGLGIASGLALVVAEMSGARMSWLSAVATTGILALLPALTIARVVERKIAKGLNELWDTYFNEGPQGIADPAPVDA